MVRDGGEPVGGRVMPDLVTAGGLAMEHGPEGFESAVTAYTIGRNAIAGAFRPTRASVPIERAKFGAVSSKDLKPSNSS